MSELTDQIRKDFEASDNIRDKGLTTPSTIQRFDDIVYGRDEDWQVLDVYRPKSEKGLLPVIISVHGGNWVYGDKERYQFYCMNVAERGFAVVNFTYRLAPEFQFPASLEDTNLVVEWVLAHADEYGLDSEHIFFVGDSAGAHILGLYAAICTNANYASEYMFHVPEGFVPTAIALNCGKYDLRYKRLERTEAVLKDFLPEQGSEKERQLIQVVDHVTNAFPPTFLMTSNCDFLKEQAPVMAAKLVECNVPFVFSFYGTKECELYHVFHCDIRSEAAAKCNDEECAYFRTFL